MSTRSENTKNSKRVTITVPTDLLLSVDRISRRMGVTRSALIVTLLREFSRPLTKIVDSLPPEGSEATEADLRRFRGASAEAISEEILRLLEDEGQHDLFK